MVKIVSDELAINGPTLLGDLVDCLEARYATAQLPVYTADFEIGTGEFPIMSPIYKRMDMGDARYDLINYGKINPQTWDNLTESWYPSDVRWRVGALERTHILFKEMFDELTKKYSVKLCLWLSKKWFVISVYTGVKFRFFLLFFTCPKGCFFSRICINERVST